MTYKTTPTADTAALDDGPAAELAPDRRSAMLRGLTYDQQVAALSPIQADKGSRRGDRDAGRPASLRKFLKLWRRFMKGTDTADPSNAEHADKLADIAVDLAEAALKWEDWSDEQMGKAARACDKARKKYFKWRREAQQAGLDKYTIRAAWRANRQIVEARNQLRAAR